MRESYSEGLAIHAGLESCGYVGNDISEALTGVHAVKLRLKPAAICGFKTSRFKTMGVKGGVKLRRAAL